MEEELDLVGGLHAYEFADARPNRSGESQAVDKRAALNS
jgi:hypothetical protein